MHPGVGTPHRGRGAVARHPVGPGPGVLQVRHVALLGAEEEAVLVVRVAGRCPVVAVVTTSLVIVTSLDTALEAGYGHQVVDGPAPAPARPLIGCRRGKRDGAGQ